jgi:hypothetical protein
VLRAHLATFLAHTETECGGCCRIRPREHGTPSPGPLCTRRRWCSVPCRPCRHSIASSFSATTDARG